MKASERARWDAKVAKYCAEHPDMCENGQPLGPCQDELSLEFLSEELAAAQAENERLTAALDEIFRVNMDERYSPRGRRALTVQAIEKCRGAALRSVDKGKESTLEADSDIDTSGRGCDRYGS